MPEDLKERMAAKDVLKRWLKAHAEVKSGPLSLDRLKALEQAADDLFEVCMGVRL